MNENNNMRELLDKVALTESRHVDEKLDEFLTIVITECNIEYLDEGVFGKFGDWVANKLSKPNVDPAEFAKVEANVQKEIISKYEGIPANTTRIVIPVQVTDDLSRIAKEGPSDAMLKSAISFGKKFGGIKKDLLTVKDYKSVGNFKFAALIDIKDKEFDNLDVENQLGSLKILFKRLSKSVLKKGVWGAIKLKGSTFKDMIPETVLGIDPDQAKAVKSKKVKADDAPVEDDTASKPADAATSASSTPADSEDDTTQTTPANDKDTEDLGKEVEEIVHNIAKLLSDKKLTKFDLNTIIIKVGELRKLAAAKPTANATMDEESVKKALGKLGYKAKEIDGIFDQLSKDVSTEDAIKQALKLLSK